MEFYRTKPENQIVIVDEAEFDRIDAIAKLKEEEIEKLAEEKFLQYVKSSGIDMKLSINGVPDIFRYDVISEMTYNERGYPESVSDEVKHAIVDDITHYINKHFEHYKSDCKLVVKNECRRCKIHRDKEIKYWKYLFYITFFVLLVECICKSL